MNIFSAVKSFMHGSPACTPGELKELLDRKADFVLLDVRRADELAKARIEGAVHVPLDSLENRIAELESKRDAEIVVMCHHGMRSSMAANFLRDRGFSHVRNLTGGIDAYASVDPAVGRY